MVIRTLGHRVAASAIAIAAVVAVALPAHAELENVFVLPGNVCLPGGTYCSAGTAVYVMLPNDYAACTADFAAGVYNRVQCGWPTYTTSALVGVSIAWNKGGCAQLIQTAGFTRGLSPLWSYGPSSDGSAPPTCSAIDESFTQTLNVTWCPGTSFQITAEVTAHADGTFLSNYKVSGSGPCANAFDVIAVEGPSS